MMSNFSYGGFKNSAMPNNTRAVCLLAIWLLLQYVVPGHQSEHSNGSRNIIFCKPRACPKWNQFCHQRRLTILKYPISGDTLRSIIREGHFQLVSSLGRWPSFNQSWAWRVFRRSGSQPQVQRLDAHTFPKISQVQVGTVMVAKTHY